MPSLFLLTEVGFEPHMTSVNHSWTLLFIKLSSSRINSRLIQTPTITSGSSVQACSEVAGFKNTESYNPQNAPQTSSLQFVTFLKPDLCLVFCEWLDYLALDDLRSQPLGMAVAQVASRDSHLLPGQAELKPDLNRPRSACGAGGSHCGHVEGSCGKIGSCSGIHPGSEWDLMTVYREIWYVKHKRKGEFTSITIDIQ